jgi:hypothetical protein
VSPEQIRTQLAEYLESQVDWREAKAEEYPDDARNQRSASGLRDLAVHARGLQDGDPLLDRLEELSQGTGGLDVFALMTHAAAVAGVNASQFRFHDPDEPFREFLDRLVAGAEGP